MRIRSLAVSGPKVAGKNHSKSSLTGKVIDIDGHGVDVDGSGSVSVSGSEELNYRGLAEITSKQSFLNRCPTVRGHIEGRKLQFPFGIAGTIDSPLFSKGKGDKGE
jgi:hypothetical protein